MSDTGTQPTAPVAPAAPAAAPAALPPEPTAQEVRDYQALYNQEVEARRNERNLYRPVMQTFRDLHPDEVQSLAALADAVRAGDTDAIVDWSLSTAQNVSAKDLATIIAERNRGGTQAPQQPVPQQQPAGIPQQQIDLDTVRRTAAQEAVAAVQQQQMIAEIKNELAAVGHEAHTPIGQAIIMHARTTGVSIAEAAAAVATDFQTRLARQQQALAAAAAATPATAPAGAPSATAPTANMTGAEKALARLRGTAAGPQ